MGYSTVLGSTHDHYLINFKQLIVGDLVEMTTIVGRQSFLICTTATFMTTRRLAVMTVNPLEAAAKPLPLPGDLGI